MISVGLAAYKPPGTEFVWFTTSFTLIIGCITILLFALGIENLIIPTSCFTWPIFEAAYSVLASILYFVSLWLCINGADFNDNPTPFTTASLLSFLLVIIYGVLACTALRMDDGTKSERTTLHPDVTVAADYQQF
ncbi:unnamed protein product [Anisakis simplex]|uniref:MARVEL domain-containing protein n=1 Tax=Anisakis simplex TaxID=6269 RepID=A0A0M3JUF2_ANISI|nr:unnamed protein product [Anisakis simplex]